ncbi:putative necrosis-inducing factor-domain-containing protein [Podospora aff. communis PSN243]|uniref:Necrosis-inducing factor-domain-containing protein n=1 Tax=Podospora aff. communis PSN243 TaxID=3040156 RepID=A0AAV9H828_9PEZI|nr:putative necrosis-inducing factor-domain-containing protein [Podospora aff. communis PSN243]
MLVANLHVGGLALFLAMFGQTALAAPAADAAAAAPAPDASKDFMAGVDTSTWVSVEFQGKTITYNPAIVVNVTEASASGTSAKRTSVLAKRAPCSGNNDDCCGGSSFNGTPAPWAWTSDCAAIRDWAYSQSRYFSVVHPTGDYHGVVFAGSCAFGAGSWNILATYVGSADIGDVTRDAINIFAGSNGQVGAYGTMKCALDSDVFWKLQCNGC